MPRRKPKPSFWQRLLGIFGLGKKKAAPKKAAKPAAKQAAGKRPKPAPKKAAKKQRQRRQPEKVEVTTSRLYVGNLSYDASESDLFELFNGVGRVANAEVVYHSRTQRSKGYAFVEMDSLDEALRAVEELHDKEFMGRKMVVSGAKKPQHSKEVA